jgi:hypothetical protein
MKKRSSPRAVPAPQEPAADTERSEPIRHSYELWEQGGRATGRDIDHWLAAEREVNEQADR